MCRKISKIKKSLIECINQVVANSSDFVKNPTTDFIRNRKISFKQCISAILAFGGGSLTNELLDFYDFTNTPTSSAFVQQRTKISYKAFEFLFSQFNKSIKSSNLYKGYQLLAVDGSDIHIPTDKTDSDSYYHNSNNFSYNLLHLNALYDLCGKTYCDAILQKSRHGNEHKAFVNMIDRYSPNINPSNVVFIVDRGYESYNNLAHVQNKNFKFLFRIKDINNPGIASSLELPDCDEYDVHFKRLLTRSSSKFVHANKNKYKYLPSKTPFDFLPKKSDKNNVKYFSLEYRIVRIKISENTYEMLATNLPENEFPPNELKKIYSMRWGIETSFRELKHIHGMLKFHSKKVENIYQEVFAKLTMFNFTAQIMLCVIIKDKNRKYDYHTNHAVASHTCRKYFSRNISPHKIEAIISKNIVPFRPNRSLPRTRSRRTISSFHYRVS